MSNISQFVSFVSEYSEWHLVDIASTMKMREEKAFQKFGHNAAKEDIAHSS
jgi:hypothetical protein